MPRFEIEVDDKGEFVGQLPAEVDAILKRVEITAHGTGFRGGQSKATEEAKAQIASAVAAEKARLETLAPIEREKYQRESEENKTLKEQMLIASRETDKAMKAREEAHATQLIERADALKKRNAKIVDLTKAHLLGEARANGARDESLAELAVILHAFVGYNDDMEPFIRNEDGSQKTVQGKPQGLGSFVKEYLDGHAHHKRPAGGAGGGARGGASTHGHTGTTQSVDSARQRVEQGDRSPSAINELFEASRKRA